MNQVDAKPHIENLSEAGRLAYGEQMYNAYYFRKQQAEFKLQTGNTAAGYCEHASNYHTFAGSLKTRPATGWWNGFISAVKARFFARKALQCAERMIEAAGGIRCLEANQLDVHASILRVFGRYKESIECCELGIGISRLPNTKMLLEIGLGSSFSGLGEHTKALAKFRSLDTQIEQLNLENRPRFYREYARALIAAGDSSHAKSMIEYAQELCQKHKLMDQYWKLEALKTLL